MGVQIRVRKMSYRPKLAVLIIAVTLVLLTNRTFMHISSSMDARDKTALDRIEKLAKEERLAKVNRISANFASFQVKQELENGIRREIIRGTDEADLKLQEENEIRLEAERRASVTDDQKSYINYLYDYSSSDVSDEFVNLHQYDFTINNENACNGKVLTVILIHSDPRKSNERKMIRDTWGSVKFFSGATIVPLFLLAKVEEKQLQEQILLESEKNRDIIQGNFIDSYRNLTLKCVMGLHWVQHYCNHTKFVVKVDDDTMIDVYHLVSFLLQKSPDGNLENFLYCSIYRNQGPRRTKDDKWFVSDSQYPYSKYPPYCEGFAYIMSNDVARKLYVASKKVKFYWIDDVYVTGFTALKAGVSQSKMERGHGYSLLEAEHLSKGVQSSMFLLAKYDHLRKNWGKAWNDILSLHKPT